MFQSLTRGHSYGTGKIQNKNGLQRGGWGKWRLAAENQWTPRLDQTHQRRDWPSVSVFVWRWPWRLHARYSINVSIPLLFIFDHSLSTFFPHLFLHLLPYILPHLLYRYWYSPSTKTTRTRKPPPPVKKMIRRASSFNQQLRMSPSSGSPKSEAGDWQQTKKKTKNSEGLKYWGKLKAYVVGTAV